MTNWKDIHSDFTPELQTEWKKWFDKDKYRKEKTKTKTQLWIQSGLTPQEAQFAKWLENKNYIPCEEEKENKFEWEKNKCQIFNPTQKKQLKTEYLNSWGIIHPDFDKKTWWGNETYQQEWEEIGLTKTEAEEWITGGFKLDDLRQVQQFNFPNKYWFAKDKVIGGFNWLGSQFCFSIFDQYDLEQLRTSYKNKNWLAKNYPNTSIKELDISLKMIRGVLSLNRYTCLEKLNCWDNKITNLELEKCTNLREIYCWGNNLTNLDFLDNNYLPNLEKLYINDNPKLIGSLRPFNNLTKLKELYIGETKISNDLEYLPTSLKYLYCEKTVIAEELEKYGNPKEGNYINLFKLWKESFELKKYNQQLTKQVKELQTKTTLFQEKEKQIIYLELRVQELTNLIRTQKKKIINTFLRLYPERHLLQELITIHLEFTRFKEIELDSDDYCEKYEEYEDKEKNIKKQLKDKLDKSVMSKIMSILTDCEHLVRDELELEHKLKEKTFLIKNQKEITKITDDIQELSITDKNQLNEEQKIVINHEDLNKKQISWFKNDKSLSTHITIVINNSNEKKEQCISDVQGNVEVSGDFKPQTNEYQTNQEQPLKDYRY